MKRHQIWIVVALLTIGGVFVAAMLSPSARRTPTVEFTLINGAKLAVNELQGRPVLINFWATSCKPCIEEIPELTQLYVELRPRGLQIIGVAMPYDPPARVLEFSKRYGIPYPVALDIDGRTISAFGDVAAVPTTLLIAPDGRILLRRTGVLDVPKVRQTILRLLEEGAHTI